MSARGVSLEEALAIARAHAVSTPSEDVPVVAAAGRVLAGDVRALADVPGFTNAALDGYAVRAADTPGVLRLVGEGRAGRPFGGRIGPGEATGISTGAAMPAGADAVLRRENAGEREGAVEAQVGVTRGEAVRVRGEDLPAGAVLLPAGHRVRAHEVGALSGGGHASVAVLRRPGLAVLTTGDEVAAPGTPLRAGQVWDASRAGVAAQAAAAGAEVVAAAWAPDDHDATLAALDAMLDPPDAARPDVVVTVGGVSVGRHDHVRRALAALGVDEELWGVEMRPGHPTFLGTRAGQVVLGLPGNPVSATVVFHALGRPLLGHEGDWTEEHPLAVPWEASHRHRAELVRCRVEPDGLVPMPRQWSHAISSLAGAVALAWIPAAAGPLPTGSRLRISRLP